MFNAASEGHAQGIPRHLHRLAQILALCNRLRKVRKRNDVPALRVVAVEVCGVEQLFLTFLFERFRVFQTEPAFHVPHRH